MDNRATSLQTGDRSSGSQTSLRVVEPQSLWERIHEINDAISRRAFELFADGGWQDGRDRDDWFRAEAEMLHPAHLSITEDGDNLKVMAEVPGFEAKDLKVSLEPTRLTISGKRESQEDQNGSSKTVYHEHCLSEILRVVELPAEVDASKASATLQNGVLELRLPKAAGAEKTQVQVKAASGGD